MNTLLLLILTCQITQCPTSYPSQVIYSKDHNYIHYSGQIHSKKYVTAVLETGKKISVPVINGLMPRVKYETLPNGGMRRDFWYDQEFKYDGRKEIKYTKDVVVPPKAIYSEELSKKLEVKDGSKEESLPSKKIEMPDPQLEEIIRNIEKTLKEPNYDVPSLKSLTPMKKPSEFDKESK